MKITAWIQMGCERREVEFELPAKEHERRGEGELEGYIEEIVLDWIISRYGWGWLGAGFHNDFTAREDSSSASSLVITRDQLNPATLRMLRQ